MRTDLWELGARRLERSEDRNGEGFMRARSQKARKIELRIDRNGDGLWGNHGLSWTVIPQTMIKTIR